ncbi:GTP-binding protein TrmE N-terminal domain protein [Leptospira interrogans serovar Bataviae str. HAI135]|nr:GTP-binding protein TrmE N-terminal domain protein [Leptospira interrogans serovar Bataviae str. HAI135]
MNDTIAAVSTPSGAGAIGIIRISGPEALTISSSFLFQKINFFLLPKFYLELRSNAFFGSAIER